MKKTLFCSLFLVITLSLQAQAPCPPSNSRDIHIVQKGETLYGIARQYKTTTEQLARWNDRDENAILLPCTALRVIQMKVTPKDVPQSYSNNPSSVVVRAKKADKPVPSEPVIDNTEGAPENEVVEAETVEPTTNTVVPKSNIEGIASPNFAYFGNSPFVPFLHITTQGETPQSIGSLYGLTESDVMMMNNLSRNNTLIAGQKLVLEHRDQRKMGDYRLDPIDNSYLATGRANDIPQNYSNKNNANSAQPNLANASEFGGQPAKTEVKEPEKQSVKQPSKPTNKAPFSSNTAMSSEEMDMVKEINLMRNNPAGYVTYIKEYIAHLKQNGDMGSSIQTSYELIDELEKTPKLSTLQPLQCVYIAAKKHGEDQKRMGDTNHTGSDGSMPWDRILRECPDLKDGNENLVGGPSDIRRAVILLLVDDGIDSRGHRKTLLNPEWQYVACYKMGTVGSMPNCWVQKFGF
jgi:LysM repeat protein